MRFPINGKIIADGVSMPVVGMLVNAPNGIRVGHIVLDETAEILAVCAAVGKGAKVLIHAEPLEPFPIAVKVIELESKTMRFMVHAQQS